MTKNAQDYFYGNDLASSVWKSKYALKHGGKILELNPDEMHRRMAREFARIENNNSYPNGLSEEVIYSYFKDFGELIPQGSVMAQLGNPYQVGSLSNCIVLPKIHDSYGGIMYTDQQLVQVMKRRCGAGIDISTLRPSGTSVSNAAQSSTGAVSFMHRFSNSTREVAQDGRRGALMISLDIRHPEAEGFAAIKHDLSKVTGANISLKITDEFMQRVENKECFIHRFPVDHDLSNYQEVLSRDTIRYDSLEDHMFNCGEGYTPFSALIKKVDAYKLWQTIIGSAHKSAEPGLIFWDRQHYYSPSSLYREFCNISTNPCSEIAMGNDSCRLLVVNMFSCVVHPFTSKAYFDLDKWYDLNYQGMRLMDDLVDLELEKIEAILQKIEKDDEPAHIKGTERQTWEQLRDTGIRGRRTGLGYTAVGDTLAALGLKYDSNEALEAFQEICRVKMESELTSTIDLAEERGAFPAFDAKLEAEWAKDSRTMFYMIEDEFPDLWERMQKVGRRNISWSTIAPAGSLSLLTKLLKEEDFAFFGSTSGIEPLFKVYYIRRKKINPNDTETRVDFTDQNGDKWQEFPVFHEGFKMWYQINHPENSIYDLSKSELDEVIKTSPYGGSTAEEIDWIKRVELQSIAQKYITHSISSTINLPNNVTTDEVSNIYFESWKRGLKGITIYRDGSRSGVLVSEPTSKPMEFLYHDAPKRPKDLDAELHSVSVKGQRYAMIIGFLNNKPYEVFGFSATDLSNDKGKLVKTKKGHYDFLGEIKTFRDIQDAARHADEQMLTRLVSGMLRHGVNPKFILEQIEKSPLEIVSFGKALARVIKKYIPEKELLERHKCKDCGSNNIRFEEGCAKCLDCGSAKCG